MKQANNYSLLAVVLSIVCIIATCFFTHLESGFHPLAWDTMGYQVYLVELFVHHTIHIHDLDFYTHIMDTYHNTSTLYQFTTLENGEFITRYPCGWAIMNLLFFIVGHLIALFSSYPADGYSYPYQMSAFIGSIFYTVLGVIWLRKVLLHFFTDKQTVLLLLFVCFGTNYLFINAFCLGLIHSYLFALNAFLILQTIRFHETKHLKYALLIGGAVGLMAVSRPTEIIVVLIPLLWGVTSKMELKKRWHEIFKSEQKHYLLAATCGLAFVLPQLVYWKLTTGYWIFDSYQNPAEGLDLLSPHTLPFLFGFQIGWWIYTPIMLMATFGLVQLYKSNKAVFWSLTVFFVLNLYLVSSWTCWWYAGCFSSRAMMQSYPVMGILLGYFLFYRKKGKQLLLLLAFLLMGFNLFQTWQYYKGILKQNRMTFAYYCSVFGQTTQPTKEQLNLLTIDRTPKPFAVDDGPRHYIKKKTYRYRGKKPFVLSQEGSIYTNNIEVPYGELTSKGHIWIRIQSVVEPMKMSDAYQCHLVSMILHKRKAYGWLGKSITTEKDLTFGKKDTVRFDYLTPHIRSNDDILSVGLWLQGGDAVKVYDFSFEVWESEKE